MQATRAVTETNARMVKGKPIYVTLAQRREVRKAQLEQQYSQNRIDVVAAPRPVLPGMFQQQPPYGPQFYAGAGPMGPPGARPSGPPLGPPIYPPMMQRGVGHSSYFLFLVVEGYPSLRALLAASTQEPLPNTCKDGELSAKAEIYESGRLVS